MIQPQINISYESLPIGITTRGICFINVVSIRSSIARRIFGTRGCGGGAGFIVFIIIGRRHCDIFMLMVGLWGRFWFWDGIVCWGKGLLKIVIFVQWHAKLPLVLIKIYGEPILHFWTAKVINVGIFTFSTKKIYGEPKPSFLNGKGKRGDLFYSQHAPVVSSAIDRCP